MFRLASAVLALAVVWAGCLSNNNDDDDSGSSGPVYDFEPFVPPEPDFDFSGVVDPDHVLHEVPMLHTAGHGLDLVGHAGVADLLPLATRGSITAIDVWGDYAVVAGMEGGLAFVIIDISDPANPKAVGWAPSAADGWTARFSDDGQYIFYGCQMLGATGYVLSNMVGTCTDPTEPHPPSLPMQPSSNPGGITVWDVADKTDPKFVTFIASGGSHNIYTANIGGEDYVFTSSTNIIRFDRETKTLEIVADLPGTHDTTVVRHPGTGDWLLFTGTGELSIYNVNNPREPTIVYEGTSSEGWTGWHDQVLVPGLLDGRAILLLAGESFCQLPVSPALCGAGERLPDVVTVVDITDPTTPVMMGTWQPPFQPALPWASYQYSVHEMAATPTGQVAIAWYHAGVWVIDVSTEERQGGPVTLAAYQPHEMINVLPATFAQTPLPFVPMVWGAGWDARGYLIVPDMHTGVYVLEPEWGLIAGLSSGQ